MGLIVLVSDHCLFTLPHSGVSYYKCNIENLGLLFRVFDSHETTFLLLSSMCLNLDRHIPRLHRISK